MYRSAVMLALVTASGTVAAQTMSVSAGPLMAAPTGALRHYVAAGWGGVGSLTWRKPERRFGLRFEASYIAFPFGPADHLDHPTPSFAAVTANSGSTRLTLLAGPELAIRFGAARASLHALAGPVGAFTVMSLDGLGTDERYSQRKRYSDLAAQAQTGLGVGVSLGRTVAVDFLATYGVLTPTSYGLRDEIKVGVISGPYWGPERHWSQFASYRLQIAIGT